MISLTKLAMFAMDDGIEDAVAEDAATTSSAQNAGASSGNHVSLKQHDARFHPNGYKDGDACKYRDALAAKDKFDTLGVQSAQFKSYRHDVPQFIHDILADGPDTLSAMADEIEDFNEAINLLGQSDPAAADIIEERDKEVGKFDRMLRDYAAVVEALGNQNNPIKVIKHNSLSGSGALPESINVYVGNLDGSSDVTYDDGYGNIKTAHFTPTAMGGTGAMEGEIDINGVLHPVILKVSNKQGAKYPVPAEAIRNEHAANQFLRHAGVLAPDGDVFDIGNGEVAMLTEKIENTTPLNQVQMTPQIQEQLRQAYPLLDVMYATDAFRSDNIRVDPQGAVWFVDNGAAFEFKGKGDKREKSNPDWKGFEFAKRDDAYGKPDADGYDTSYGALYGSQRRIRQYLGKMTKTEMLQIAANYDMSELVSKLPKEQQSEGLKKFAKSLDDASDFFRHVKGSTGGAAGVSAAPVSATPSQPTSATGGAQATTPSQPVQQNPTQGSAQGSTAASHPGGFGIWAKAPQSTKVSNLYIAYSVTPAFQKAFENAAGKSILGPSYNYGISQVIGSDGVTPTGMYALNLLGSSGSPLQRTSFSSHTIGGAVHNAPNVPGYTKSASSTGDFVVYKPNLGTQPSASSPTTAASVQSASTNTSGSAAQSVSTSGSASTASAIPQSPTQTVTPTSTTPSSGQTGATTAASGANASKASGQLSAMGAKNPRMAALYSQVAAKLAGKPVQQQSPAASSSGSAQQTAGSSTSGTTSVQQQGGAAQSTATATPQTFNHKGMKHLQSLMAKNPHLAKTYQAAISKLNAAGVK